MMKTNRKVLALLVSAMLAASVAGCGNPAENSGPDLEAAASLQESTTEMGAGPDTGEPAATAEPTTAPTTEPTAEPTVEPTAEPTTAPTAEPTVEPTAEPATEPVAPSPEEQAWVDAVYASYIKFLDARAQANARLMEGDIDGYTKLYSELRQPAYNDFVELLGISDGKDGLLVKLSPYSYAVGFDQKGVDGTYLLKTSDGMHLGLIFMNDDNVSDYTESLWVITNENPKTYYGLEVIWIRNYDTASGNKLMELEASGIEEDTTKVLGHAIWIGFE